MEMYTRGTASLREYPTLPRQKRSGLPDAEFSRVRSEYEKLLKARTFADPQKGYSKSELMSLIDSCEKANYVLGTSMIARLLGVPKGNARDKLQAAAVKGRWTWSQLSNAIRVSGKTKKTHANQGRTVKRPDTEGDALSMLYADCVAFRKRAAAITAAAEQIGLTTVVQVGIEAAMKEILKLEKTTEKQRSKQQADSE
jgi:hypothetical protein